MASRKPTCNERMTRLESGWKAATISWKVEKASAIAISVRNGQPPSVRGMPCSDTSSWPWPGAVTQSSCIVPPREEAGRRPLT